MRQEIKVTGVVFAQIIYSWERIWKMFRMPQGKGGRQREIVMLPIFIPNG